MRSQLFTTVFASLVVFAVASPVPQRGTDVTNFGYTNAYDFYNGLGVNASLFGDDNDDDDEDPTPSNGNAGSANGGSVTNNATGDDGIITNDNGSGEFARIYPIHTHLTQSTALGGAGGSSTAGEEDDDPNNTGNGGDANGGDVTNTGSNISNTGGSSIGGAGGTSSSPSTDGIVVNNDDDNNGDD